MPINCVIFQGCKTHNGYGQLSLNGKRWRAHRLAYMQAKGAIPGGMMVLHHCDNPACINPDHLFLGTARDNTDDMMRKGRYVIGRRYPKLTPEQVQEVKADQRSSRKVAADYGVSHVTIQAVRRCQ